MLRKASRTVEPAAPEAEGEPTGTLPAGPRADAAEQRFRRLLDAAPDAVVTVGRDGRIRYVNRIAEEMFGYPADELLGQPVDLLVPDALRERHAHFRNGYYSEPHVRQMGSVGELLGRRRDGSVFPAEIRLAPVGTGDDFEVMSLIGDGTEARSREHALRQSEEHLQFALEALEQTTNNLRAILDASPLAIIAQNLDRRIVIWNGAAERMFGWTAPEVIGGPSPIVPDSEGANVNSMFDRIDAGEVIVDFETTRVRRDGTPLPVSLSLASVVDELGARIGSMAVIADISRRKEAEETARKSRELLQRANESRRRLLSRLVRAQEQERQQIANDIHDDSVQVMTAFVIRLEALRRRIEDEQALEMVDSIEQTARASIVRLRHLMFELRPAALDRDGLVSALRIYLDSATKEHEVEAKLVSNLSYKPGPECRTLLYRIAHEAITNVLKHADASHLTVTIREGDGGPVVRVEDDGHGFQPAESEPGHLGLASMHERAELGGGWLRIESSPQAGTIVEFFVPDDVTASTEAEDAL
jgi:PAS domain S-box-containing protein